MTSKIFLSATLLIMGVCGASAQADKPAPPNPSHITFTHLTDFQWQGDPKGAQQHIDLVGDPSKPGLYIRLAKWLPHHFSKPHFHDKIRHFFVLSGTWWVSSSATYDESKTYPMNAGTFVTDLPNKAHFDGAKDEPGIIAEIGFGPLKTTPCDANNCKD